MSRSLAREDAFKLVFEMEITGITPEDAVKYLYDTVDKSNEMWAQQFVSAPNRKYIEEVVYGIVEKKDQIIAAIEPNLKDWSIARISKVALCVLELAVYEILFMDDIPGKVSASEAVLLAKKYAGKDDASFVNGVIGTIIELKKDC